MGKRGASIYRIDSFLGASEEEEGGEGSGRTLGQEYVAYFRPTKKSGRNLFIINGEKTLCFSS